MALSASVRSLYKAVLICAGGVAALAGQVGREQIFLDVAVGAVGPVAQVAVAQFVAKEADDALLRGAFGLADVAHTCQRSFNRSGDHT